MVVREKREVIRVEGGEMGGGLGGGLGGEGEGEAGGANPTAKGGGGGGDMTKKKGLESQMLKIIKVKIGSKRRGKQSKAKPKQSKPVLFVFFIGFFIDL